MAQTRKKVTSKKDKNSFTSGVVHIQSTFNNTIVTITNLTGDTILGFSRKFRVQRSSKSTPLLLKQRQKKQL
jgi:small subunit ribosomal protein S11